MVGGRAAAGHVIGSTDENPYMRSGGHLGVGNGSSCDTSGTCGEEPNTSGSGAEGELEVTWSGVGGEAVSEDVVVSNGVMICSR